MTITGRRRNARLGELDAEAQYMRREIVRDMLERDVPFGPKAECEELAAAIVFAGQNRPISSIYFPADRDVTESTPCPTDLCCLELRYSAEYMPGLSRFVRTGGCLVSDRQTTISDCLRYALWVIRQSRDRSVAGVGSASYFTRARQNR